MVSVVFVIACQLDNLLSLNFVKSSLEIEMIGQSMKKKWTGIRTSILLGSDKKGRKVRELTILSIYAVKVQNSLSVIWKSPKVLYKMVLKCFHLSFPPKLGERG